MNSIGFTNFRKFVSFPEIPFGDITIMVGGNNAGKSTLVKAMLLMRDFLKSRIESASNTSIFKSSIPQFSFDAEHVNVGDFYRAFCRQSPYTEDTISFVMKISKFHFSVDISGERKPGIIPQVSKIDITDYTRNTSFSFDFKRNQMSALFSIGNKDEKQVFGGETAEINKYKDRLRAVEDMKNRLSQSNNLAEISELKLQIENLENEIEARKKSLRLTVKAVEEGVTIDMSHFLGDNIGKLVIPELVKGFVQYAQTGTLGDKRSQKYKNEEGKKAFLQGKAEIINEILGELDSILNSHVLEYIYSHSVAQTPCYSNATSSNDYATRTIHEFYRARISLGDDEFTIIEDGLKLFGIGKSLKVMPFLGDSYRVVIFDEENPEIEDVKENGYPGGMDLADKGMGSIQIILLLLRFATLTRKYKGLNLTVLLEEPEQNLHPALQSKLADLVYIINKKFDVRFIIETHSEYLVRHIQVLSAKIFKDGADETPFKVVYLTGNKDKPCYDMGFHKNGKFKEEFGLGFFNVADDAAMELFDLDDED